MPAARELRVRISDKPGVLGQVSVVLREAGINIEGFAVSFLNQLERHRGLPVTATAAFNRRLPMPMSYSVGYCPKRFSVVT